MDTTYPVYAPHRIPGITPRARRALQGFYREATRISPALAAQLALALFVTPGRVPAKSSDRAILARAKCRRVRFERGSLCVFEWGESGPAILLAHGWSSRAARLSAFVQPLIRSGFRVVAFDAPGHGASSGLCCNVYRYRDAMQVVMQRCAPISGIVAHSLGARAAMLLLSACALDMRAACLIAVPPDVRHMFEQFKLVLDLQPDVSAILQRKLGTLFGPLDQYSREHATQLQFPVLLVHDEMDDVAPYAHAAALARELPRGELLCTRQLDHCGPLRDAAAIAHITRFMERHAWETPRVATSRILINGALPCPGSQSHSAASPPCS